MRSFFITIALAALCSCALKRPYFDLHQPIYLVTDQSFWSGCDKDSSGEQKCRQYRVDQINAGISQWFDYFDKANRPRAVVVFSEKDLPQYPVNQIIHLGISNHFCPVIKADVSPTGKVEDAGACYTWPQSIFFSNEVSIVFENKDNILPVQEAHEFGHALGRDDNDVPEDTDSVMSYKHKTDVTTLDVKMMCEMHRECRMVKRKVRK